MRILRILLCLSLLCPICLSGQTVKIDHVDSSKAAGIIIAGLSKKDLKIESYDAGSQTYTTTPFDFTASNHARYTTRYTIQISDNALIVGLTDILLNGKVKPSAGLKSADAESLLEDIRPLLSADNSVVDRASAWEQSRHIQQEGGQQNAADKGSSVLGNADFDGISLSMTMEQARNRILAKHPGAKRTTMKANLGDEYYKEDFEIGEYFLIEPFRTVSHEVMPITMSGEAILLLHFPSSKSIVGIFRYKGFKSGDSPTSDTVKQALLSKFGKPNRNESRVDDGTEYVWTEPSTPLTAGSNPNSASCEHDYYTYSLWKGRSLADYPTSTIDPYDLETAFTAFINGWNNQSEMDRMSKTSSLEHCGKVARIRIGKISDVTFQRDYVYNYDEALIDHDKTFEEFRQFSAYIDKRLKDARAQQLQKDSERKPTF